MFSYQLGPEPRAVFAYGVALLMALLVFAVGLLRGASRCPRGMARQPGVAGSAGDAAPGPDHGAVIAALGACVGGAALGGLALSAAVDLARGWPVGGLRPGLVFYGGLLGGAGGLLGTGRALGLRARPLLDLAAIPAALAHAVGRVGCLLGGCCYGTPTDLPWGVVYLHPLAPAAVAGAVARHPVQLYEAAGLCLLSLALRRQPAGGGRRFVVYLSGYALLRLATELLRGDPERGLVGGVLSTSELASLCALAVAAVLARRWRFVRAPTIGYTGGVRAASSMRFLRGPEGPVALALACVLGAAAVRADSARGGDRRDSAVVAMQGPDRVRIESGDFLMGSDADDLAAAVVLCGREDAADPGCRIDSFADEGPRRRVFVTRYAIDRTEVDNASYRRCVTAGACLPSETSASDVRLGGPRMPVTGVGFAQARSYCGFVGGRLPSEAEWERAARGGSDRRFPWGDFWSSRLSNYGSREGLPEAIDGYRFAAPVDAFPDGRSPHGLLNMAGNVWEWTADFYDAGYYREAPRVDPRGPSSGTERVIRGGSWRTPPVALRTTQRAKLDPEAARPDVGFRCAY